MNRSRGVFFFVCFLLCFTALPAFAVDTDGDGLDDNVEFQLGSSPTHKDIFVYISYFIYNGKSVKPRGNFAAIVKDTFASAPVNNPDGRTGITLHVEIGPPIRTNDGIVGFQQPNGALNWDEFDFYKNRYFPANKWLTHHYCLFVGDIGGPNGQSTGISGYSRNGNGPSFRQGASDSIVALGHPSWFNKPTAAQYKWTQAGTFLHEIGHNFGFQHGGNDHISFKPNHLSLMSYAYQTEGIPITIPGDNIYYLYDYARFAGPNMNENNLNEFNGMGQKVFNSGAIFGARWYPIADFDGAVEVFDASRNVDWNHSGILQVGVRQNLNILFDSTIGTLRGGTTEWSRLVFSGGLVGRPSLSSKALLPSQTFYPCLKASEWRRVISAKKNIKRVTFNQLNIRKK